MKKLKSMLCLLLAVVMVLGICACGKTKTDDNGGGKSDGGTTSGTSKGAVPAEEGSGYKFDSLTIGTTVMPNFITGCTPAENDGACSLVFDEVFKIDRDTKEPYSDILEEWHFEDENTLIMKLKDGIYFSNGDKATAEDLLFSYSSHPDRSSAYIAEFGILYDQCEIIDELTLSMKFEKFYSAFYSSYIIYLYDKSWCESVGWDSLEWQKPVGTGPYACTEYKVDDSATFTARDDYWNKDNNPVQIRQWVMKYYQDASTMELDLEAGNIVMCSVSATEYERFLNDGGDGFDIYSGSNGVNYIFQMGFLENDCWYNESVRKAFAVGIPWAEFGEVVLGVCYQEATSVVPKISPEYKNVGTYEYNVDEAKKLLAEAGYDETNPLKLHTVMMSTPFYSKCCEAFEYYCSQLGVEFTYDLKDISAAINDWNTPGSGVELGFYYDNFGSVDAQYVRGLDWAANPNGSAWTYIDDEAYDNLYLEVAYETDTETRIAKSQELQQMTFDQHLAIPFAEATFQVGYRTDVFSAAQMKLGVMNNEYYNLADMSYASAWK